MEFCSHCQTEQSEIVVKGQRLVSINRREHLVPYALCKACNNYLRAASYKQYNNVKHDKSERLKNNFWHKVDLTLKSMQQYS